MVFDCKPLYNVHDVIIGVANLVNNHSSRSVLLLFMFERLQFSQLTGVHAITRIASVNF